MGFRIVRALETADGSLPLKELSQRAGMPASKAYAYVASFVHEGLLVQDSVTGRPGATIGYRADGKHRGLTSRYGIAAPRRLQSTWRLKASAGETGLVNAP